MRQHHLLFRQQLLHAQLVDLIRQAQPRSLDEGRALVFEGRRADDSGLDGALPRSPAELIAAFVAVRSAFALTKNRVLAGLR